MDDIHKTNIQAFNAVMDTFNLKQHVNFATLTKGHTLDLFITPEECKYKIKIKSTEILSDHFSVTATIDFVIPKLPPKTITYRAVNKINFAQFKNDLAKSDLLTSTCSNASSLYQLYHSTLSSLLNKHAPIKTKTCSSRPKDPWMSEDILMAKRKNANWKELGDIQNQKFIAAPSLARFIISIVFCPRPRTIGTQGRIQLSGLGGGADFFQINFSTIAFILIQGTRTHAHTHASKHTRTHIYLS